jgi:hypothetical protein
MVHIGAGRGTKHPPSLLEFLEKKIKTDEKREIFQILITIVTDFFKPVKTISERLKCKPVRKLF